MKVLWFTNSPCMAYRKLNSKGVLGGWMQAMEEELAKDPQVELFICFYWDKQLEPFSIDGPTYIPIYNHAHTNGLNRFIKHRFFNRNNASKSVKKLLKIIESVQPDLIHVHGTEENYGLVQKFLDIPTVVSFQGIISPYVEKFFSGIPQATAKKHTSLFSKLSLNSANEQFKYFQRRAKREQEILEISSTIAGRTKWDRRIAHILAPQADYFLLEDMLRKEFYTAQWTKTAFDNPVKLITITTDGIYKGIETIVKTAAILQSAGLDISWTIIGQSENETAPSIIKKWLNANYKKLNIQFIKLLKAGELIEKLKASDIYCHTSHIENSPNSVCEAMMLGMPVIASWAGGTNDLIKDGHNGILIQEGEPYSLAGAIKELCSNFPTAQQYGKNARQFSLQKHKREKIADQLKTIYRHLVPTD